MFFLLSKAAWFFLQPLNLAIILLLLSLALGFFGRRRLGAAAAVGGVLILALASWTSLGAQLISPLEERFRRPAALPAHVDGILVLGGGLEGAINLARGGYEMNSGGDRFVEAAALAHRFPEAKVLVTGGMGTVLLEGEGDGETAPRLLDALGVAPERLILESKSRNTAENATFSKALVEPKPGETWLLVTSAFHMPRSVGLFRKAGFPVVPWPTDYRTSGREGLGLFRDNEVDALQTTSVALREWIGLVAYWLSGRIDTPFPGPE
ncbi:MAG: YdcF family protein [Mesorhizobium sp.]